jgi:hypothetical protein
MRPDASVPRGGRMKNRVVVGLVLWLTAVCSVAGLAWFAIDSAGKSVTALPISQSGVAQQLESDPEPTVPADLSSTPPVAPPSSSDPTGVSTGALSVSAPPSDPTSSAGSTGSPSRTSRPSPPTSRPTQRPTPPPPPKTYRGTESGGWGTVTVGCRAGKVSLLTALPGQGWQMDVRSDGSNGATEVEVVFSPQKGKPVQVTAGCLNDRPDMHVGDD